MTLPTASDWITVHQVRAGARVRLVCFPYAGAGASAFRSWGAVAPPELEISAIQMPGRETRLLEPPMKQLAPLVKELADALAGTSAGPCAFFGHSVGALIAFEVARELHRAGRRGPACLFVSAHRAPHLARLKPAIHDLPDAEFLEELRALDGTPEGVLESPELMRVLTPILRADMEMAETYRHQAGPLLDCPITACGGRDDDEVLMADLAGWRQHTRGPFVLRMFPGGHFFLNQARDEILRAIMIDLGDAVWTS